MPNSHEGRPEAYQAWTLDFQIIKPHSSLYKGMFSLDGCNYAEFLFIWICSPVCMSMACGQRMTWQANGHLTGFTLLR